MQHRSMIIGLVGLAAAAALAAQAGAQDARQAETWRLAEVDGRALPVVVDEEDACREELLAATLTLDGDGGWVLETSERETCGDRVEEEQESEEGRYTTDGRTLNFTEDDDGADADIDDADPDARRPDADDDDRDDDADGDDEGTELEVDDLAVGTRARDGLSVRLEDGRTMLLFRR